MQTAQFTSLNAEILPDVLEQLGTSLAEALPCSQAFASAGSAGDAAAFRPLSFCLTVPSPGGDDASRCGLVARSRYSMSWREVARVVHAMELCPISCSRQASEGDIPTHRHSMAVCGSQGADEKALLFGGNISRSVAGNWQTSSELFLASLPQARGEPVELKRIDPENASWPCSRWGATLTQTTNGAVLWGGWSREGQTGLPWMLRMREARAEWSQSLEVRQAVAFHTATAVDAKRVAVVGGLGEASSRSGVWIFDSSTEQWQHACNDGPSVAGAAAGFEVDTQRLVVCLGVQRDPFRYGDNFLKNVSVFDMRMQRWDEHAWAGQRPADGDAAKREPCARRQVAVGTFGSRLIVTGGHGEEGDTLSDTWSLNMRTGHWTEMSTKGPKLSAHKAVISGLDIFTFGGHSRGGDPGRDMSVNLLQLGHEPTEEQSMELDELSDDSGSDESDTVGGMPIRLLMRLIDERHGGYT
eukprot:TRINITY_DN64308_c0_g1_i1.p1 TRINITY_DN64308_c0_g1~~TRINITY_DN64308_c0_g1_i1.p1  ORF type:complete len:470 (-),score=75.89 TRINITY_DN64308_c0_g1_i1:11-1420(-)